MRFRLTSSFPIFSFVVIAAFAASACKKPKPQAEQHTSATAEVSSQPPVIILLDAAPPSTPSEAATFAAVALVTKWSTAHQNGDAQELQSLFAPKVTSNGTQLSAAEHVKKTLHQENPEERFSIGEVRAEATPDGKEVYAHFAKRITTSKRGEDKTTEYPRLVIVREGVIVEDSDDPPDWCLNKDKTTNTKTQPGFKLSAAAAVAEAKESKHFAELKKRVPRIGSDLFGFGCAKRCAAPRRECGYHFRLSDMETKNGFTEWVYVDPVSKTLWWQEKDWMSEQLR